MNEIDLHGLDLNLLVTFEVLMSEGNVTRAARRLGRGQSAISHALQRLREQLGDPLMVHVGGRMRPSPFALTLIEEVRPLLLKIQRVIAPPEAFQAATSKRLFRIAVPTFTVLLSAVIKRIQAVAPQVSLEWTSPNDHAPSAAVEGQVDIAHLGGDSPLPDGLDVHVAQPFGWVTFARKDHPALSNWGVSAWMDWPHVCVGLGNAATHPIDEAMRSLGVQRKIGARVSDFASVAPLLARTDMLGTFPPLALTDNMELYGLRALQPPFLFPPFGSRFFWSSRLACDPGRRWIRAIVLDTYSTLQRDAEAKLSGERLITPKSTRRLITPSPPSHLTCKSLSARTNS